MLDVRCSAADVFAKGNIATANVSADGTGRVTVAGVQKAVNGQLSGITYLFVGGASGAAGIFNTKYLLCMLG